jgi:hypothetical protein
MVIFQTPDGNPGYNQFETLDEAVRFVEKLRNEQSVETARMFALDEVKFDFKPYFRVEIDPPAVGTGTPTESPIGAASSSNGASESPAFAPPSAPPAPPTPPTPPVSFGEPPAPPTVNDPDSPVGPEPATVGATPPPPTFMAPPAPPQPNEESQTTRRGLFGR